MSDAFFEDDGVGEGEEDMGLSGEQDPAGSPPEHAAGDGESVAVPQLFQPGDDEESKQRAARIRALMMEPIVTWKPEALAARALDDEKRRYVGFRYDLRAASRKVRELSEFYKSKLAITLEMLEFALYDPSWLDLRTIDDESREAVAKEAEEAIEAYHAAFKVAFAKAEKYRLAVEAEMAAGRKALARWKAGLPPEDDGSKPERPRLRGA